jgi:quercetin dioxygenase-like cupin family protein
MRRSPDDHSKSAVITRASDMQSQENAGSRLLTVASPASGASDAIVVRVMIATGSTLPAHSHDREEVLYVLSGIARYTIASVSGSLSAGDLVVVPANALHSFDAREDLDAIGVLAAGAKTFAPDGTEFRG